VSEPVFLLFASTSKLFYSSTIPTLFFMLVCFALLCFALLCFALQLHPFPFDGSKTAADGVAMALPMVTLPTAHLRGRMGAALYSALGMDGSGEQPRLVARDAGEYVSIAVRLATDLPFRAAAVRALRERRHEIFAWPPLQAQAAGATPGPAAVVEGWHSFLVRAAAEATEAFEAAAMTA